MSKTTNGNGGKNVGAKNTPTDGAPEQSGASLVPSTSQTATNSLAIPDDVMALMPDVTAMAPIERELFSSPYLIFAASNAKIYPEVVGLLGPIPEGTPVLVAPNGKFYRLDNCQVWLTPFRFQHWSVLDNKNSILQSALLSENVPNDGKRWAEHMETIAIVMTPDGPIPTRIGFRTTKCSAAHDIYAQLQECVSKPEKWAARSAEHAAAVNAIPQAWLRMFGVLIMQSGKSANGDYVACNANVKPTSPTQFAAIAQMLGTPGGKSILEKCIEDHKTRETEVKKKCI